MSASRLRAGNDLTAGEDITTAFRELAQEPRAVAEAKDHW